MRWRGNWNERKKSLSGKKKKLFIKRRKEVIGDEGQKP